MIYSGLQIWNLKGTGICAWGTYTLFPSSPLLNSTFVNELGKVVIKLKNLVRNIQAIFDQILSGKEWI